MCVAEVGRVGNQGTMPSCAARAAVCAVFGSNRRNRSLVYRSRVAGRRWRVCAQTGGVGLCAEQVRENRQVSQCLAWRIGQGLSSQLGGGTGTLATRIFNYPGARAYTNHCIVKTNTCKDSLFINFRQVLGVAAITLFRSTRTL